MQTLTVETASDIFRNRYLVRVQTGRQGKSLPEISNFLETLAKLGCQLYLCSTVHHVESAMAALKNSQ